MMLPPKQGWRQERAGRLVYNLCQVVELGCVPAFLRNSFMPHFVPPNSLSPVVCAVALQVTGHLRRFSLWRPQGFLVAYDSPQRASAYGYQDLSESCPPSSSILAVPVVEDILSTRLPNFRTISTSTRNLQPVQLNPYNLPLKSIRSRGEFHLPPSTIPPVPQP